MTEIFEAEQKTIRLNKRVASSEVQLRLNVIALAKKAGASQHQDEAMKFSQAALNLANAVAALHRLNQGDY